MSDNVTLEELIRWLAEERGLDLRAYKHSTLERRVRKRMHEVGVDSYPEYLEKFRSNPKEVNALLNVVLINVTEFFRDPQAWEALRQDVLPRLFGNMKPGDSFRGWSAGCASGEEPYSLAILAADYFGAKLPEYDIKIYATDIDEEALRIARHGQYPAEHLRLVRPEWRERYFQGSTHLRINRDVRRMVIFGCSNLVSDAPISHCDLLVCRNVLIYFDAAAQKQVLARLHYALDPTGILFLGKAESKLTGSELFQPVNARWRIFQRIHREAKDARVDGPALAAVLPDYERRLQDELAHLRLQQQSLLETVRCGVITLDANDTVTACNEAAQNIWGLPGARLLGRQLQTSELIYRCPELTGHIEAAKSGKSPAQFHCTLRANGEEHAISVTIRVLASENGDRVGAILNCEDVTSHERLQATVEELEATGEELQSANEELETTNEELQSTNEELETTNEELQSTNEELETTNEELQSLNEELENMNQELESRTRELNGLTGRYEETLRRMPWPVILVDRDLRVQLWNSAAQKVFGVASTSVVGVELQKLPADTALVKNLVRRCRAVMESNKIVTIRDQKLRKSANETNFDVQLTPASRNENETDGVLLMFGLFHGGIKRNKAEAKSGSDRGSRRRSAKSRK